MIKTTKDDKKNLKYNTIALMVIQILNYVLPFITLPYISRIFAVDKLGIIFFSFIIMDYFFRLAMFGFEFSAVRQIAIHSSNKKVVNYIFNSVISIQTVLVILGFLILSLVVWCVPKFTQDWIIYYFSYLRVIGLLLIFNWFYQGIARMKFITVLNIISGLLSLILIFTCIKKPEDYIWYPLIISSSLVVTGIFNFFFIKKHFNMKLYVPKIKSLWKSLKYSSEFFLTKIAISLYRSTNAFVLGLVVTSTAVAYYVAADKIFWAVFSLYYTFITALFPFMSKNKDIVFFKKILKYLILFAVGFSLFLFVTAKYIIIILFSEQYLPSVNILRILSISLIFMLFVDILGFPFLGAFGYVKETNRGYIFGGIYNVIGLILLYLLGWINIYSVALLVSSTYLAMFLHRIYYICKYKKIIEGDNCEQ